ncbi:hypothetical protein [Halobacterium yunchengense]|uniref:hypothetical protein n=1 Tax=Halobacterium yunchengense TaxID=3108497 RepID=UPI00300B6DF1
MTDSTRLVDIIFDKSQPESVDFEIAFTALIATGTLAASRSQAEHSLIVTICAVAVLILTLVRRMGVSSPFPDSDSILNSTVQPIEFLTIVCLVEVSLVSLRTVGLQESSLGVFSAILVVGVLGVVIIQELVFGDYMIWWGAAFYTKGMALQRGANEADNLVPELLRRSLSRAYLTFAYKILDAPNVIPDEDLEKWNTLRSFVEEMEMEVGSDSGVGQLLVGTGIVLAIGYGVVSWILSFTGYPVVSGLLFLFAIMAIRHLIGFWYLAYGSQHLSRFLQGNTHHLATMGVYGGFIYWLFFT